MIEGIKVEIRPEKFPDVILTTEEIEAVNESILNKIIELSYSADIKPQFHTRIISQVG